VYVGITKITEGNRLKLHTFISEYNWRPLYKVRSSNMDFHQIIALFEKMESSILSKLLFYYEELRKVEHAVLLIALVLYLKY
jgi:hypothetical protein